MSELEPGQRVWRLPRGLDRQVPELSRVADRAPPTATGPVPGSGAGQGAVPRRPVRSADQRNGAA
ncbi:hypothetical protein [Pseudonocardia acidicola]|uniref:Uncharacterized protein n=1 Tax=Pseudonocardia acidicola TaxID=2724939 RepID=A0ABX1SDF5_9PSEU|nr:hypothetical protein [Pseudonocardia acidicola]NMH98562.1 hypothetical protein [Pseudonocardia acidicola]